MLNHLTVANGMEFLNTSTYDNENDNSSVIYFNYYNYKFLFMGDASITREKDILEKYNLKNIDFLKVGHHGSNTSSSEEFINSINHKFLFMGDAGVEVEEDLIEKYSLQDIDVLKVGHHGSKTSSDKNFIDEIDPKYSVISVGKNNRYNHANKEVLNNLSDSKIYRTDQDGSIMFKIKNTKLRIETYSP